MNHRLIATIIALSVAALLPAQDPAAKPAAGEKERPFTQAILEQALKNMASLKGYHIDAEITTPVGKAKLEGDLGVGALSLKGQDPRGNTRLRIAVDEKFFFSPDGGKTWKTGADADQANTIFFSRLITGPVDHGLKIWEKGEFKATEEKVNNEELLHLEKPAAGKEPAAHFWLVREPSMDNAVFVRKVSITIAADDGDFPVTVTYTKLNQPAGIKAPVVK